MATAHQAAPAPLESVYQTHHDAHLPPAAHAASTRASAKDGRLLAATPSYVARTLAMRDPLSGDTHLVLSLREPVRCTLTLAWAARSERPQIIYAVGNQRSDRGGHGGHGGRAATRPDLWMRAAILRHAARQCAWIAYIRRGDGDEAILHDAHTLLLAELAAVQDERVARLSPAERREAAALDAAMDRAAVEYRQVMGTEGQQ